MIASAFLSAFADSALGSLRVVGITSLLDCQGQESITASSPTGKQPRGMNPSKQDRRPILCLPARSCRTIQSFTLTPSDTVSATLSDGC